MSDKDTDIVVVLPPDAAQWVADNAYNYDVTPEFLIVAMIGNRMRREHEIATKGHTKCSCGRDMI